MNKANSVLSLLLLLALTVTLLAGCGVEAGAKQVEQAPAEAEPVKTLSSDEAALSPFVGNWKLYAQEGDIAVTHEELQATSEKLGYDMANTLAVTLREDGTMSVNIYGSILDDTWTDKGDDTGVFHINGQDCAMNVQDGLLRIDMAAYWAVFEPCDQSAEEIADVFTANLPSSPGYQKPEQKPIQSLLIGQWRFYSRESEKAGKTVAHEALPELKAQGKDYARDWTLSIGSDGWMKFTDFYGFEQNSWTDKGDNTGTLNANGETCQISIEDGFLLLRDSVGVTRYERLLSVGTTGFVIAVPADYTQGDVSEAERRDDMVAYYRSDERLMDFDVYQFAREGRTLADYAAAEAKEYGAVTVESLEVNGIPLALYYSEEQYGGVSYRVANYLFTAGDEFGELSFWLDGEDAEALSEQIISTLAETEQEEDDSDKTGVVVEKLEGDFFPERYLVRTDSGELYECEYIGFEELEPGAAVTISKWGRDWMIELDNGWSSPSKPEKPESHLYTTKDGVTVDDPAVKLVSGTVWNFAYTLANPTDKDADFDPALFELKTADGTEIKTAAPYLSKDHVSAGCTYFRISMGILSKDLIQLGDKITVFYDGTYLDTVIAGE